MTNALPLLALISSSSSLSIVASLADVEEVEGFQEDFTSSLEKRQWKKDPEKQSREGKFYIKVHGAVNHKAIQITTRSE